MDPVTIGVLAAVVIALLVLVVGFWLIRLWVRSMVRLAKFAIYGGFGMLAAAAVGAAVLWVLYGDQIRAALG